MTFAPYAELVETGLRLMNPRTARAAASGMHGKGFLFHTGGGWKGLAKGLRTGSQSAWDMTFKGAWLPFIPISALSIAAAPRGHRASAFAGSAASMLATIPGAFFGGTVGGMVSGFMLGPALEKAVAEPLQKIKELGRRVQRPQMGGDYVDFEAARTMRQRAAQDLSGSLLNARQYLGKESVLFHS